MPESRGNGVKDWISYLVLNWVFVRLICLAGIDCYRFLFLNRFLISCCASASVLGNNETLPSFTESASVIPARLAGFDRVRHQPCHRRRPWWELPSFDEPSRHSGNGMVAGIRPVLTRQQLIFLIASVTKALMVMEGRYLVLPSFLLLPNGRSEIRFAKFSVCSFFPSSSHESVNDDPRLLLNFIMSWIPNNWCLEIFESATLTYWAQPSWITSRANPNYSSIFRVIFRRSCCRDSRRVVIAVFNLNKIWFDRVNRVILESTRLSWLSRFNRHEIVNRYNEALPCFTVFSLLFTAAWCIVIRLNTYHSLNISFLFQDATFYSFFSTCFAFFNDFCVVLAIICSYCDYCGTFKKKKISFNLMRGACPENDKKKTTNKQTEVNLVLPSVSVLYEATESHFTPTPKKNAPRVFIKISTRFATGRGPAGREGGTGGKRRGGVWWWGWWRGVGGGGGGGGGGWGGGWGGAWPMAGASSAAPATVAAQLVFRHSGN